MRFGLLLVSVPKNKEDYYADENEEFRDEVEEMKKKADLIELTLKDGEKHLLTRANFNFGQCDCCGKISKDEIAAYRFYKKE